MKPKYPHMRQWEEKIMTKFHDLKLLKAEWTYDVPLKVRHTPTPDYMTRNENALWQILTSKRIDALGETPTEIYVCEIKDRLRPSALGQALTYKTLYEEQYAPTKPIIPAIITEYDDLDMQHVCDHYKTKVWVI
ncbi:MAG: hypothetical protein U9Q97_03280 [Acidobacteriota bacterium]|nr:hypothetical protein [Acidobacteriota bacterium]